MPVDFKIGGDYRNSNLCKYGFLRSVISLQEESQLRNCKWPQAVTHDRIDIYAEWMPFGDCLVSKAFLPLSFDCFLYRFT
jgi:hypothetical protein